MTEYDETRNMSMSTGSEVFDMGGFMSVLVGSRDGEAD